MYGSCRTLELLDQEYLSNAQPDMKAQVDARILELEKVRRKFYDQRREFNK